MIVENESTVCVRCLMDTSHTEITFGLDGVCNFCKGFEQNIAKQRRPPGELEKGLQERIERIRIDGRGREHDCILGVSGGVDSSYLALKCKDWNLRPLLVQFDNGWNSELALNNIQALCNSLSFDLYTYVVNWPEFRDLQMAFLKAGVVNVEAPSDHGIFACIYLEAIKRKIPWLLTGVNSATESNSPVGKFEGQAFTYGYRYDDLHHLKAIHREFGTVALKTFPTIGWTRKLYIEKKLVKRLDALNWMQYNKADAINELQLRIGWRPYPGKHFESVITRFHQSYILPTKFGLDKRRLHLSGLIWSQQLTRAEAITEFSKPICDPKLLEQDKTFFLKKMKLSAAELKTLMESPPQHFSRYSNLNWLYLGVSRLFKMRRWIRSWGGRFRKNSGNALNP